MTVWMFLVAVAIGAGGTLLLIVVLPFPKDFLETYAPEPIVFTEIPEARRLADDYPANRVEALDVLSRWPADDLVERHLIAAHQLTRTPPAHALTGTPFVGERGPELYRTPPHLIDPAFGELHWKDDDTD